MSAAEAEWAFRQAIIEAPDEDAPRLIFADWLDEQGETTRAEFIRQQVAAPDHSQVLAPGAWLRRRLDAKGVPDGEVELLSVPVWCSSMVIRRGFVEAVTLRASAWYWHADELLITHPIREVTLTTELRVCLGRNLDKSLYLTYTESHRKVPVEVAPPAEEMFQRFLVAVWPDLTFHLPEDEAEVEW